MDIVFETKTLDTKLSNLQQNLKRIIIFFTYTEKNEMLFTSLLRKDCNTSLYLNRHISTTTTKKFTQLYLC